MSEPSPPGLMRVALLGLRRAKAALLAAEYRRRAGEYPAGEA